MSSAISPRYSSNPYQQLSDLYSSLRRDLDAPPSVVSPTYRGHSSPSVSLERILQLEKQAAEDELRVEQEARKTADVDRLRAAQRLRLEEAARQQVEDTAKSLAKAKQMLESQASQLVQERDQLAAELQQTSSRLTQRERVLVVSGLFLHFCLRSLLIGC